MPQFNPGEERVAIATFPTKPAGLECTAELWLASNMTKVATSGEIPFIATGGDKSISLPIALPGVEGAYPVHLSVFSNGLHIAEFLAVEDVVIVPVADRWVSPSSYRDPDNKWSYETRAYDGNLTSLAMNWRGDAGHYVEYILRYPLICSKVREYIFDYGGYGEYHPDFDIDLYYDEGWHNIFSARVTGDRWLEQSIPEGTKIVSKLRIKNNIDSTNLRLAEVQFWGH